MNKTTIEATIFMQLITGLRRLFNNGTESWDLNVALSTIASTAVAGQLRMLLIVLFVILLSEDLQASLNFLGDFRLFFFLCGWGFILA